MCHKCQSFGQVASPSIRAKFNRLRETMTHTLHPLRRAAAAWALGLLAALPGAAHAAPAEVMPDWELAIGDIDPATGRRDGVIVERLPGNYGRMFAVWLADLGDFSAPVANWITARPEYDWGFGRYSFASIDYLGRPAENDFASSVGIGEAYLGGNANGCWPDCLPDGFNFLGSTLQITRLDAALPEPGSLLLAATSLFALLGTHRRINAR